MERYPDPLHPGATTPPELIGAIALEERQTQRMTRRTAKATLDLSDEKLSLKKRKNGWQRARDAIQARQRRRNEQRQQLERRRSSILTIFALARRAISSTPAKQSPQTENGKQRPRSRWQEMQDAIIGRSRQ